MSCRKKPSLGTHTQSLPCFAIESECSRRTPFWTRQLLCLFLGNREGWTDADTAPLASPPPSSCFGLPGWVSTRVSA